jgi:hypothetical protein
MVCQTNYLMGTGGSFPVVKQLGYEDDHSSPSSAKVKMNAVMPTLPQMLSWHA